MEESKKTILIVINQGFGFRYLIQTDIFKYLQSSGNKIILLIPNYEDKFYKDYKYSNVFFVPPLSTIFERKQDTDSRLPWKAKIMCKIFVDLFEFRQLFAISIKAFYHREMFIHIEN